MPVIINGSTGITNVNGSASTPAETGTDTDTGIYYGTNTVGLATNGTNALFIDASQNVGIGTSSPTAKLQIGSLSGSNATYVGDIQIDSQPTSLAQIGGLEFKTSTFGSGYGWKISSIDSSGVQLVFGTRQNSATWTEQMRIDSSGNVGIGTSSPSTYGAKLAIYSAASSTANIQITNPGIGTGTIGLTAASSNFKIYNSYASGTLAGGAGIDIDTSGNVGVNTTTTTRARLNIDTDGTNTSAGYGLALTNTAGGGATWTLQCGDQGVNNGAFTIRQTGISGTTYFKIEASTGYITVPGVYALTTASAANVFVGTGGDLRRSTSSLKYKTDVQDATYGLAEVMVLRPVTYKGKNDGDTIFGGLIAEEVDAAGLTEFVQYADDGTPDALAYGNMVSLCIKAIQEQQALITALTARIEVLESK